MSTATQGTVAGRPQPQTTAEPAGGPFVRHAPDGRRAMYVAAGAAQGTSGAQFVANPMVSSPGWNKGYRVLTALAGGTSTAIGTIAADAPYNFSYEVPLFSGQFGIDETRSPNNLPSFAPVNSTNGAGGDQFTFPTYCPFEFAKGYGVISGANAALLPVLQINLAPI